MKALGNKGVTYPEWHQIASLYTPETAGHIVRLLMSKFNTERPDGLIITNDNHTPHVQNVLHEIGVKVPEELSLVSLCNFPTNITQTVPVKLIGFQILDALKQSVQMIDDIRNQKKVPFDIKVLLELDD